MTTSLQFKYYTFTLIHQINYDVLLQVKVKIMLLPGGIFKSVFPAAALKD